MDMREHPQDELIDLGDVRTETRGDETPAYDDLPGFRDPSSGLSKE